MSEESNSCSEGHVLAKIQPSLEDFGRIRPMYRKFDRSLVKFGHVRPKLTKNRLEFGQHWPNVCRKRAELAEVGPALRSQSNLFGNCWPTSELGIAGGGSSGRVASKCSARFGQLPKTGLSRDEVKIVVTVALDRWRPPQRCVRLSVAFQCECLGRLGAPCSCGAKCVCSGIGPEVGPHTQAGAKR